MIQTFRELTTTIDNILEILEGKAVEYIMKREGSKTPLGIECTIQGYSEVNEGIFEVTLETDEGLINEIVRIPESELGETH